MRVAYRRFSQQRMLFVSNRHHKLGRNRIFGVCLQRVASFSPIVKDTSEVQASRNGRNIRFQSKNFGIATADVT